MGWDISFPKNFRQKIKVFFFPGNMVQKSETFMDEEECWNERERPEGAAKKLKEGVKISKMRIFSSKKNSGIGNMILMIE